MRSDESKHQRSSGLQDRRALPHFADRRAFVVASAAGIAGFSFQSHLNQAAFGSAVLGQSGRELVPDQPASSGSFTAKSTILFFLSGGAHILICGT